MATSTLTMSVGLSAAVGCRGSATGRTRSSDTHTGTDAPAPSRAGRVQSAASGSTSGARRMPATVSSTPIGVTSTSHARALPRTSARSPPGVVSGSHNAVPSSPTNPADIAAAPSTASGPAHGSSRSTSDSSGSPASSAPYTTANARYCNRSGCRVQARSSRPTTARVAAGTHPSHSRSAAAGDADVVRRGRNGAPAAITRRTSMMYAAAQSATMTTRPAILRTPCPVGPVTAATGQALGTYAMARTTSCGAATSTTDTHGKTAHSDPATPIAVPVKTPVSSAPAGPPAWPTTSSAMAEPISPSSQSSTVPPAVTRTARVPYRAACTGSAASATSETAGPMPIAEAASRPIAAGTPPIGSNRRWAGRTRPRPPPSSSGNTIQPRTHAPASRPRVCWSPRSAYRINQAAASRPTRPATVGPGCSRSERRSIVARIRAGTAIAPRVPPSRPGAVSCVLIVPRSASPGRRCRRLRRRPTRRTGPPGCCRRRPRRPTRRRPPGPDGSL